MKVIIYTRPDGGLSVVHPCISKDDPKDFTEKQAFDRALAKDVPKDAISITAMEKSEIPMDRSFRNAWKNVGGKVDIDMPKAKDMWRDRMRYARAPLLTALDIEYQRADEVGDNVKKAQVVAQKKQLRDVTDLPEIESAKTPDELKAVWPSELGNV